MLRFTISCRNRDNIPNAQQTNLIFQEPENPINVFFTLPEWQQSPEPLLPLPLAFMTIRFYNIRNSLISASIMRGQIRVWCNVILFISG